MIEVLFLGKSFLRRDLAEEQAHFAEDKHAYRLPM